jgi:hypothetical protein
MKKSILMIGGILVLVLLLAGAAFVGGQLLNGQGLQLPGGLNRPMGGGSGQAPGISIDDIMPAEELPQTPAEVGGVFDHRQNNSIFVGTGLVMMGVQKDESGNVVTSSSHDGPTVEVVVTAQTTVYQDMTMRQFDGPPPQGQKIQQVVEPGSLDEIDQNSAITVWGRQTGERVIADVLVYTNLEFSEE